MRSVAGIGLALCAAASGRASEPVIEAPAFPIAANAGMPVTAAVTLTWPTAEAPGGVWVDAAAPVEWGEVTLGALTAERTGDAVVYRQDIVVTAAAPGRYEAPALDFYYAAETVSFPAPAGEGADPGVSSALIPLQSPAFAIEAAPGGSPKVGVYAALAAAVCVTAAAFGFAVMRRRRTVSAPAGTPVAAAAVPEASQGPFDEPLLEARRRRAEGDLYGYYRALIDAVAADAGLVERLRRKAEDVGFRHLTPAPDELDGDLRDVERALARYKEKDGA